jgi:Acyl-coenzyme A synthetases/AMP-(fatty) acid ligases
MTKSANSSSKLTRVSPSACSAAITETTNAPKKVFRSGVYHTGDTATRDKDGYYWFVGRNDDLIKSSGYRISPFEVEEVIHKHPAVLEVAVTGVEDKDRGQAVKATIVLQKGLRSV